MTADWMRMTTVGICANIFLACSYICWKQQECAKNWKSILTSEKVCKSLLNGEKIRKSVQKCDTNWKKCAKHTKRWANMLFSQENILKYAKVCYGLI